MMNVQRIAGDPRVKQALLLSGAVGAGGLGVVAAHNILTNRSAEAQAQAIEEDAAILGLSAETLLAGLGAVGLTGLVAEAHNDRDTINQLQAIDMLSPEDVQEINRSRRQ